MNSNGMNLKRFIILIRIQLCNKGKSIVSSVCRWGMSIPVLNGNRELKITDKIEHPLQLKTQSKKSFLESLCRDTGYGHTK